MLMFLLLFFIQIEAESTLVDTQKILPSVLKDLYGWFETFNGRYGVTFIHDGFLRDLSQPLVTMGGKIYEHGLIGRSTEVIFNGFEKPVFVIDGLPFEDPVFGTNDIDLLAVDLFDKISYVNYGLAGYLPPGTISLTTKRNLTDIPSSQLRYLTGSTDASKLGLDYSRGLTRHLGCFISVNQLKNLGYRYLGSSQNSTIMGSLYGKIGSPFNLNIMSIVNRRTVTASDFQDNNVYGGTLTCGDSICQLTTSYFRRKYELYKFTGDTLRHRLNSLGFVGASKFSLGYFDINLGTNGTYHSLNGNYLPIDNWFLSNIWGGIKFTMGQFNCAPKLVLDFYNLQDQHFLPQLNTNFMINDSLFIFLDLARVMTRPSIRALHARQESVGSYIISGNSRLKPELRNQCRIGVWHQFITASLYVANPENSIVEITDSQGVSMPQNSEGKPIYGCDVRTCLQIFDNFKLHYSGNYSFQDSFNLSYLGLEAYKDWHDISLLGRYEKVFNRCHIHSLLFALRFIDFNFFLKFENLLNELETGVGPRSVVFGVFWDFQD